MKKFFLSILLVLGLFFVLNAQNVPQDSFALYHEKADALFTEKKYDESVSLLSQLALSGDASAAYELAEIYSQGYGVEINQEEAEKWLSIAENLDVKNKTILRPAYNQNLASSNMTSELNQSGESIELGGKFLNAAVIVGLSGSMFGSTLAIIGARQQKSLLSFTGYAIIGAAGVTSLALSIIGINNIKWGGHILKELEFNGNEVKLHF